MRSISGALIVALALLMQAPQASALGFGRISNSTVLGQQLDFSVVLTTEAGEAVTADCVTAEVSAGDNPISSTLVRTRLDVPADGGAATLRVITNVRIDEPVASVNVGIGCPARLTRKFTVFIDPPVIAALPSVAGTPAAASAAASDAATATPVPDAPVATRPLPGAAPSVPPRAVRQASAPTARSAPRGPRGTEIRVARAAKIEPQRVAQAAPRPSVRAAPANSLTFAAPRLKLEAELPAYRPAASGVNAAAVVAATPFDAASAARADVSPEVADAEKLRIQLLEQNIQKLMIEARATQSSLATMQARLREAESSRFSNPLIYLLLALVALLLAAVVYLLWRQSQLKRESAWWVAGAEAGGDAAAPVEPSPADAAASAGNTVTPATAESSPETTRPVVTPPSSFPPVAFDALRSSLAAAPQSFVVDGAVPPRERTATRESFSTNVMPVHDMSVEELIDMEQQAEFFIVLGQDDAAIDLLMGHVRSGGSTSPLAFLKLLEIFRRRGEREPYDRVRERFNRRFNAYAPDWDAGAGAGQPLEAYPQVVAQLQAVWPHPAEAMGLLESLLFRRDAGASTFDLQAYGELLFLYSQARDLAESESPSGTVDVLLPLGEEFDFPAVSPSTVPAPLDLQPPPKPDIGSIDFDLDFNPPPPPERK